MKKNLQKIFLALAFLAASMAARAQNTETLYLSGTGLGDTKSWDFFCSAGMNSGAWSKIEVPSQWELQGFGEYTYGRFYLVEGAQPSSETGLYRYEFEAPSAWKGREVSIVFEGAMTDTEVKVNGKPAGEIHQGGFVRFGYNISDKLKYGGKNRLEVKVWKQSANASVNGAERRADWWLFGGIYRPVYLQAKPKIHIERIAVNAAADGNLSTEIYTKNLPKGFSLATTLTPVGSAQSVGRVVNALSDAKVQTVSTAWKNIRTWDCENPNLYTLKLELLDKQSKVVCAHEERIGFRTVEFRRKDGVYVNGTKVVMKGINRHSFHPDGGRTTNRALSLQDALLIKEMNMNAVRSHYPPDKHFLDICDSLGLFYLNELPGWHNKYDDAVGEKILKEMLARDVNHPCIFLWSNGNEGGWNTKLDSLFAVYDPQKRHVVHPWADFDGFDTHHYPAYQTGTYRLANGYNVFMPTEFLHGQYDKGHGAGLEDYWASYCDHPMFAGGFLWTYVDEAVRRTDKGGMLDSDGPNGPDGVVGPRREKEGSFYTIRELWSPIQLNRNFAITPSFKGNFLVANGYLFTNLAECSMKYRLYAAPSPLRQETEKALLAEGAVRLPAVNPGERGTAHMDVPTGFFEGDILELEAFDKFQKSVCTWTFTIKFASDYFAAQKNSVSSASAATVQDEGEKITLSAGSISAVFGKNDGALVEIRSREKIIPLANLLPVGMRVEYKSSYARAAGADALFVVKYAGAVDSIAWRMRSDGMLGMDAVMLNRKSGGGLKDFFDKKITNFGFTFSFPEGEVKGMRWLGRGPYRVWKNRIKGTNYGVWQKAYNNTVTGESFEHLIYPEFKGYHANVYWATLESDSAPFTVYTESDGLYLRLFTPEEPAMRRDGKNTMEKFPEGDISFLYDIPAIQSFKPISEHGPHSQPSSIRINQGDDGIRMKLWFDFGR